MQVEIYKPYFKNLRYQYNSNPSKKVIFENDIKHEKVNYANAVAFRANVSMQKTITTQIKSEKDKLMHKLKEVLSTEVLILSEQEKLHDYIEKSREFLEKGLKKRIAINNELNLYLKIGSNSKQTYDRINQLKKEFARLNKLQYVIPPTPKPSKENYDYVLVNKFKNAILDGNYDLDKIENEHYSALENINSFDEFKRKYISIRVPSSPKEVIVNKIIKNLGIQFYCDLDDMLLDHGKDAATDFLLDYLAKYFKDLSRQIPSKSVNELLYIFERKVAERVLDSYEQMKALATYGTKVSSPNTTVMPILNYLDIELLDIDFDKFALTTLKKIYLDRKKINEIQYQEGDKIIDISSIKIPEYRFEKIPEKMKRFIQDAKKIKELERNYEKYTNLEDEFDWYRIADYQWVAHRVDWVVLYPAQEPTEPPTIPPTPEDYIKLKVLDRKDGNVLVNTNIWIKEN